ncbi:MAG: DUF3299 domain-containing protein [Steroidobacteraceae bacterium]
MSRKTTLLQPAVSRRQAMLALGSVLLLGGRAAHAAREPRLLDWRELLPEKERGASQIDLAPQHDYLDENGPAARQVGSAGTNPKVNRIYVKVPGFVVPLGRIEPGIVEEFLLVPYQGACIHVPPPPPNQIVYVSLKKAQRIETIDDPYWITGLLTVENKDSRLASTSYAIAGEKLELCD